LSELCQFPKDQKWRLLYRATRDGFGAKDFHQKCDHFENTLVVIKSTEGNVFGGFTSCPWNSISSICHSDGLTYGYVSDASAFIFSLVNKNNKPFKTIYNSEQGIYCDAASGPSFGYGKAVYQKKGKFVNPNYDLNICSDSNKSKESYSDFGNGFKNPDYLKNTEEAGTILAGSCKFQNVEIEVFTHSD
jgi:hypothetical protein